MKTKIFVTVPVGALTGALTGAGGRCATCGGSGLPEQARVVGGEAIDPVSADNCSRRRVAPARQLRPVRGVVVDLARRRYRPTGSQRDWLILQHGTCSRDGCARLALEADIDEQEWSRGRLTNLARLRPL